MEHFFVRGVLQNPDEAHRAAWIPNSHIQDDNIDYIWTSPRKKNKHSDSNMAPNITGRGGAVFGKTRGLVPKIDILPR
jgi:hypothetical protein